MRVGIKNLIREIMQEKAKEKIKKLIGKYEGLSESERQKYNEQQTKDHFIRPLFEVLGWNFEVDAWAEENVIKKRVDYGFKINNIVKFFLEAKPLKADLDDEKLCRQAINYSWNKGIDWAILTDFESVKVFNAQAESKLLQDKLIFEISYKEYLSDFDRLQLLSKEGFEKNALEDYAVKYGKRLKKLTVNEKLFNDLKRARELLTSHLGQWNNLDQELLDEGVQRILDRLVFMRVLEDRGLENPILKPVIREWEAGRRKEQLFQMLIKKFREIDDIYNSNLFQKHACEDWEEYSDAVKQVIEILYGSNVYEYNFKEIPADILGGVYESYLGYIAQNPIKIGKSKSGKLFDTDGRTEIKEKSRKKRKEQGIYYTPKYIVDYIVQNTLGKKLDEIDNINDLKKIKVLDPACGSGSFLTAALKAINEKYKEFGNPGNQYTKSEILLNNIYGIDLDPQAVELAKLNLLIETLDQKAKLPDITSNIRVGNSLISGSEKELKQYFGKNWRDKKPFNWEEEFKDVFKQGGFDVIIGNPPWGANIDEDGEYLRRTFPNSTKEKKDTYKTFIDQSISLLKIVGKVGFIVPNSFLYQPSYEDLKDLISKYQYFVINLGEHIFDNVTLPSCILILDKKGMKKSFVIDLTKENRESLPTKILSINFKSGQKFADKEKKIRKKTGLIFDNVFNLKDAGIQYHRSGIGLSNKGGNDLYERIFCNIDENKFRNKKKSFYGKLLFRYYIENTTDEFFNLDYKVILKKKESVSFSKEAFEQDVKILWRQTAPTILATLDTEKRWFRNTIQCAWIKEEYKTKINIFYALAIFNSKYIDYLYRKKVLETSRIFPQVKIKYLRNLPFIIGDKSQQDKIADLAKKMLALNKKLREVAENSDQWQKIKDEITRTDKKIDEEVYKLYGLASEEIKIVEGEKL
jgi:type I restriction-modification system DNA methylase subunit